MFLGKRLVALIGFLLSVGVQTVCAQSLGSPSAVLDALRQNNGTVVLAFIDSPADQSSPLRNIQGLLSVYEVSLNGEDLGSIRRNSVIHVRPRLGLNRLTIRDAFDDSHSTEVSFPSNAFSGCADLHCGNPDLASVRLDGSFVIEWERGAGNRRRIAA